MKSIAIIPARIGSKRIKQKNIKDFLGKPIICYSISKAIESGLFEDVIVSTDSEKVAEIAIRAGASVPFMRDASLSDDHTDTLSVLEDAIIKLEDVINFELVCGLYATAPLLQVSALKEAKELCRSNRGKYVLPVCQYSHPIDRSFKLTDQGLIQPNNEVILKKRTQDIEINYHDAGQFYFGNKQIFLDKEKLISKNSIGLVVSNRFVCDIDDENDWALAEFQYQAFC